MGTLSKHLDKVQGMEDRDWRNGGIVGNSDGAEGGMKENRTFGSSRDSGSLQMND